MWIKSHADKERWCGARNVPGLDIGVTWQAAVVHGGAMNLGSKNLGKAGGRLALQT